MAIGENWVRPEELEGEDRALLEKVDAAQSQASLAEQDQMLGALSSPDRMQVDIPTKPEYAGEKGEANLAADIEAYKERTGDITLDGKKDNMWGRFKNWWGKGKVDDPTTIDIDESDPDTIVTSFMGGMTRQELATFMFEWGTLMMANAEEGFGGAYAAAGQGALAGLEARRDKRTAADLEAQDRALREREVAAKEEANYETMEAADGTVYERVDGSWRQVQVRDPKTGRNRALIGKGDDEFKGRGPWLMRVAEDLGRSPQDVVRSELGEMTSGEVEDFWLKEIQTDKQRYMAALQSSDPTAALAQAGFVRDQVVTWEDAYGNRKTKSLAKMGPDEMSEYAAYAARITEKRRRESRALSRSAEGAGI